SVEQRVLEHIETCPACQELLERLTALQTDPLLESPSRQEQDAAPATPSPPTPLPQGGEGSRGEATKISDLGDPSNRRLSASAFRRLRGLLPTGAIATSLPLTTSASGADPAWPSLANYEILRELGRGGMAVVYLARDDRLNRLVALKMIRSGDQAE